MPNHVLSLALIRSETILLNFVVFFNMFSMRSRLIWHSLQTFKVSLCFICEVEPLSNVVLGGLSVFSDPQIITDL